MNETNLAIITPSQDSNAHSGSATNSSGSTVELLVSQLLNAISTSMAQQTSHAQLIQTLLQERFNLTQENRTLRQENSELKERVSFLEKHIGELETTRGKPRSQTPSRIPSVPSNGSILQPTALLPTASFPPPCGAGVETEPVDRPADQSLQHVPGILWTFLDAKSDSDAGFTPHNPSRPCMQRALRHADGSSITAAEWREIRSAAQTIKANLLSIAGLADASAIVNLPESTRKYLRKNHCAEYDAAIQKLEQLHPLVALCADHWKADHILKEQLISETAAARNSVAKAQKGSNASVSRKRKVASEGLPAAKRGRYNAMLEETSPHTTNPPPDELSTADLS